MLSQICVFVSAVCAVSRHTHAGGSASLPSDGTPTKVGMGESQSLLKDGGAWRAPPTVCGFTVGWCLLMLLGVVVLVSTSLAIALPKQQVSVQRLSASIWEQGSGVSERSFELEVRNPTTPRIVWPHTLFGLNVAT